MHRSMSSKIWRSSPVKDVTDTPHAAADSTTPDLRYLSFVNPINWLTVIKSSVNKSTLLFGVRGDKLTTQQLYQMLLESSGLEMDSATAATSWSSEDVGVTAGNLQEEPTGSVTGSTRLASAHASTQKGLTSVFCCCTASP